MNIQEPRLSESSIGSDRVLRQPRRGRPVLVFSIVAVLLLVVFGGLYGFNVFRQHMIAQFFANNKPPPTSVAVAEAKAETVPKYLSAIGTLTAVRQVTISPEVSGRVVRIFFESGATVKAGDPLVQLNDASERADLSNSQAQVRVGQTTLNRSRNLLAREFAAQATVDQNQAQVDQAAAGTARVQSAIAQKQIRAPFDGELGIRQINNGQYLSAGAAVVTLTDLTRLYVNFTVPEQSRGAIAPGQAVELAVDAFAGRKFPGTISTIEPQVSADTRTIKVQAILDNPDKQLLPGMFANVSVVLPPVAGVIAVPATAVDYSLYGDSVFLIREGDKDKDGKPTYHAVRTFVRTGDRFDSRVSILSGVQAGDRVVATGQLRLQGNDVPVSLSENGPLQPPAVLRNN